MSEFVVHQVYVMDMRNDQVFHIVRCFGKGIREIN